VRKLEEDEDVRALQGSFTLSRKLPKAHQLNLEYIYRDLKDTSESTLISNPSTTVSSLRFSWRQDSRFPSLNPTSGMLNEVTLEYAGGYLGGESSFIKTIADTRYHRKLNERGFVLATALRFGITTGLLQTSRDTELISFERFWAGGSTTVRGYEDRGLGPKDITGKHRGNVQFIFNTELRFPIFDPFQGVLFFDTGNVWDTFKDIEYEWLPSTVGAGLRLNLGPLSFGVDYAFPLVTVPDVPTNSFYFRVGSTF
jgi:outer membrane protein insertion porin family